ncbi:MAG TPA: BACON domain-containing carbohydrate-binding protein, partial [Blastocatellia bacterium]|nr:BACON domain-containing carbohydrate-binding protein [Blastocatellia bacterium]
GLDLQATSGSTIRGLVIRRFLFGIRIQSGGSNTVQGCFIGTNNAGDSNTSAGNSASGIVVINSTNNLIGGTTANAGNVISANGNFGVDIQSGSGNIVQGNLIGTDVGGTIDLGNSFSGVQLTSSNNTVGGTTANARNVISGNNSNGVTITASGNTVHGNYIGTNAAGTAALANNQFGVSVSGAGTGNSIGGTAAGAGNVISGNGNDGIFLSGSNVASVQGNIIGLNAAGTAKISNAANGIRIDEGFNHTIGGTTPAARNIISGNTGAGVLIRNSQTGGGNGANNNSIQGNFIGTDINGTANLGNSGDGVSMNGIGSGANNNTVGGTAAGAGNVIAFNSGTGVRINISAVNNRVLGNSIFGNNQLGIDLGSFGVSGNDSGDGDGGANNLQNFPVLTSAVVPASSTSIQGTLNSAANTTYRVEFFSNPACDVSGNGEGQVYLGFTNVTTDAGGNAAFSVSLPVSLTFGHVVTATATDPAGNTSEFSACSCTFTLTPSIANFSPAGGGSTIAVATGSGCLRPATSNAPWITVTGGASGSGNGTVSYTVAANASPMPRSGSITIAGFSFNVTQQAAGAVVQENFDSGIPPTWTVIDGGSPGVYFNTGGALTWTTDNPCSQLLLPPFGGKVAMVDATCAVPGLILDEELRPPAFDATGLGTVFVEFFSQFKWSASAPNNKGDVDVSINGGVTWTNVLRLENGSDGVPTPATKSINISPVIAANPSNVLVRMHYYGTTISSQFRPLRPDAQELSWAIDFSIYSFNLAPTSQNFSAGGGSGMVNISASAAVPNPQGEWTAISNVPWITPASQGGKGNGSLGYVVSPNPATSPRTGTLTIAGNTFTVTQTACAPITISPMTLADGVVGALYQQPLAAGGGTVPYTFGVTAGTLPNGLTLSSAGLLSGTPTTAGTSVLTIRATDANNCIGERQYTLTINSPNNGLQFFPLPQPVRLLETRAGFTGCTTPGAIINAGGTFTLPARTDCAGIPADAQAVTGNVTVVPTGGGFLTLFPSSAAQPTVANSNFGPGEVTNNVFTVGLGAGDGAFKIFASATTHVIVDVTGYYAPPGTGGLYFHPLPAPVRLLETRAGLNGCIAPGAQLVGTGDPNADPNLDLAVQGRSPVAAPCNSIPASAQMLVGNATSVVPSNGGFLTIYPSGGTRPLIASSNYAGNDVINGPFAVKLGADGKFKIYTLRTTHLVIDILGYYSQEAVDANGVGLLFNPLPVPVRLLETRPDFPNFPLPGCTRTNAPIQGNLNAATHTQPARDFCGLPATAQAVVGNASVVSTPGAGFLTLFPGNLTDAPLVATSNYPTPAAAGYNRHYFVGLSPTNGTFKVLTQFTTELIVDVSGYFAP